MATARLQPRHVHGAAFLIVALPVFVFVMHRWIATSLGVPKLPMTAEMVVPDAQLLEAGGRLKFLASLWFYLAIVVLAVGALIADLIGPVTMRTRLYALIALGLVLGVVGQSVAEHQANPDAWRGYHQLGEAVFETALAQGRLPSCSSPADRWMLGPCGDTPVVSLLDQMLDLVNLISALGVGAIAISAVLCLRQPALRDPAARASQLQRNRKRWQRSLYLSGLLLSSGMVLALSWMHWPLKMIVPDVSDAYREALSGVERMTGVYFSLLILSYMAPVGLILAARVEALAREVVPAAKGEAALDEWKQSNALSVGAVDVLKDTLAIVAPIITAMVGGAVSII